ncbi:DNA polymerase III subunit gamma/tau [Planctomycetota bacterium]
MSYTVLARKYRSQTFDDVVGQEGVATTLKNAIKTDRVAHAFLFTGTRGVGKTTMARILAKALNCLSSETETTEPCCKCDSCVAVNTGEDIDVIEIDGATNNGVEQVRELRQNAIYRPARARYKIYIIDEVHMLSTGAFNALLKILEEPPGHVKFIFATTEPNKVLATIHSRCQQFDFGNISASAIAGHLKWVLEQEKIKYEEDVVLPLAKMANGSMRDGLSLLDRLISAGSETLTNELLEEFLGCANSEKVYNLISRIGNSDAAGTLEALEDLLSSGLSEVQIVDAIVDFMRDLMVAKTAGIETGLLILTQQQKKQVNQLAELFDIAGLVYSITTLEKMRWTIKNSDSSRALLEASLLRFALSEHFLNVDTIVSGSKNLNLKKNKIKTTEPPAISADEPAQKQAAFGQLNDIESIKSNWDNILAMFPKGTSALLATAEPAQLEGNILTIVFPASAQGSKTICQGNGRLEQIESLFRRHTSEALRIKLEVQAGEQGQSDEDNNKTSSQIRSEIMKDPAVKTIQTGLNATIIDIKKSD